MLDYQIHTIESAPAASKPVLEAAKKKFGFVPNLMGVLAEAPAAAEAYLSLTALAGKTSFSSEELHVVWFTINAFHDCRYCMAAHTAIAKGDKIDAGVIGTARAVGTYDNPRLEALRRFTLHLTEQRGWANDAETQAFLDAGFTKQHALEVVTVIAHKVMSNYTNHLAETPLDGAFAATAWAPAESAA